MGISRHNSWLVFLVVCAVALVLTRPCRAAPRNQEDTTTMTLSSSTGTAVEGESLLWILTVDPQGQSLEGIEIEGVADLGPWQVTRCQASWHDTLTETTLLPLIAVPLQAGELWPQVRVRYRLVGRQREKVITAREAVHVDRLEQPLQAEMLEGATPVRQGDLWTGTLVMRNASPFTLTRVTLVGVGTGLQWNMLPELSEMPPLATAVKPVTATVVDEIARPIVVVAYEWQDDADRSHAAHSAVRGQALTAVEPWWRRLESYAGVVFGALVGLGTSLLTQYFTEWRRRRQEMHQDQNHVLGLLRLGVSQARQALEMSQQVPLGPFENVYLSERGLYAVARRLGVYPDALYAAAVEYNAGLANPVGATVRKEKLQREIDVLVKALGELQPAKWRR